MIDAAPPVDQSVRVSTTLIAGDTGQDAAIAPVFAAAFAPGGFVSRQTLRSGDLRLDGSADTPAIVESIAGLESAAELVSGTWPTEAAASGAATGAVPTALQADAAAARGLAVGDTVRVGNPGAETTLEIAATWRATNPADPLWFADPAVISGFDDTATGPFVIAESALRALPSSVTSEWIAVPAAAGFTAGQLAWLAARTSAPTLSSALQVAGGVDGGNLTVDGGLSATASRVLSANLGVSAIAVLPEVLLLLLGAICVSQLARLLSAARADETTVLRARGASRPQLTVVSALELVVVMGLGSAVGIALAGVVFVALGGSGAVGPGGVASTGSPGGGASPGGSAGGPDAAAALGAPLGLAAAAAVLLGLVALLPLWIGYATGRAASGGAGPTASGRAGASTLVAVVVALVALLSLWQLLTSGLLTNGGAQGLNPVATPAPVLVLVATVLLLGLAVAPIARAVAGSARKRPWFPLFQVARSLGRPQSSFPVIVLVVALASGGSVLAAGVASTWSATDTATRAETVGTDARIQLDAPDFDVDNSPSVTSPVYAALPGVEQATTTFSAPVTVGRDTVTLLGQAPGIPLAAAPSLLGSPGLVDPAAGSVGVTLGTGGQGADRPGTVAVSAWFADAQGALQRVQLGSVAVDTVARVATTLSAALPPGLRPFRLLALDVRLAGSPGDELPVQLTNVFGVDQAGGALPIDLGADPTRSVTVSSAKALGRAFSQPSDSSVPDALPVVASDALLQRLGLSEGASVSLTLPTGRTLSAVVTGRVPDVAGAGSPWAVVADLPTLDRAMLQAGDPIIPPSEVWVSTPNPAAVAASALPLGHYRSTVTTTLSASAAPLREPTVVVLWIVAGAGVLLALVAVVASAIVLLRSRRSEVLVFDALGLTLRSQGYQRAAEFVVLIVCGLFAGLVAGVGAAQLAIRPFAAAASPGAVAGAAVSFDPVGIALALGSLAACLFAAAAVYVAAVERQAAGSQRPGRNRPRPAARQASSQTDSAVRR